MSCEADIPPEWVSAIQANRCPGCGGEIMNEVAKELLDELTSAMEKMPNNPQGIAGWLLSNYRFQKIGDAIPTEKFHDGRQVHAQESLPGNVKVANNPVQAMLARTGFAKGIEQTNAKLQGNHKLAQMAHNIAGLQDDDSYEDDIGEDYDEDGMVERGPRRSRELATGAQIIDSTAAALSPDEIMALASSVVPEDDSVHAALQLQRKKRLLAQQSIAGGGGQGVFRRS